MKEIIAIIRRHKLPETKNALRNAGFMGMTIQSVEGRGMQKGIGGWILEIDPEMSTYWTEHGTPDMKFIPKRKLNIIVDDEDVQKVVHTIITVNQTGNMGDGKIFVCPVTEALTIRTGSQGV